MKCPKCDTEVSSGIHYCPNCGTNLSDTSTTISNRIGLSCIVSIVVSIISFIITTIIRFCVDVRVDLTPSALSSRPGMAVPSNVKPYVLAVPVIITLITIIKTVMSTTMDKKEKIVSCICAGASLICSIAIVNWSFRI